MIFNVFFLIVLCSSEAENNSFKVVFSCLPLPGPKPKASDANFDDLLSGQGFTGTKEKKGPRTIAEMRKEEMAKEMDPEKLKAGATEQLLHTIHGLLSANGSL